jgi:hypothetical protein
MRLMPALDMLVGRFFNHHDRLHRTIAPMSIAIPQATLYGFDTLEAHDDKSHQYTQRRVTNRKTTSADGIRKAHTPARQQ